jgi:hypothetical protein
MKNMPMKGRFAYPIPSNALKGCYCQFVTFLLKVAYKFFVFCCCRRSVFPSRIPTPKDHFGRKDFLPVEPFPRTAETLAKEKSMTPINPSRRASVYKPWLLKWSVRSQRWVSILKPNLPAGWRGGCKTTCRLSGWWNRQPGGDARASRGDGFFSNEALTKYLTPD